MCSEFDEQEKEREYKMRKNNDHTLMDFSIDALHNEMRARGVLQATSHSFRLKKFSFGQVDICLFVCPRAFSSDARSTQLKKKKQSNPTFHIAVNTGDANDRIVEFVMRKKPSGKLLGMIGT